MRGDQAAAPVEHVALRDLAELRAGIYGLLGGLFLAPAEWRAEEIGLEAARIRTQSLAGPGFPFEAPLRSLLNELTGVDGGRADALRSAYAHLFTPAGGAEACLPYESHVVGDRVAHGAVIADVETAYAECGLTTSPGAGGELADHVTLELQFLSVLCSEEAHCWRQRPGEADVWLRREWAFLDRHLGCWLPQLARCMLRRAEDGLYRRLAEATHAFVVHDTDLVEGILHLDTQASA